MMHFFDNPALKAYATAKVVMTRPVLTQIIRDKMVTQQRKRLHPLPLVVGLPEVAIPMPDTAQ